jgi:hypothetical protein
MKDNYSKPSSEGATKMHYKWEMEFRKKSQSDSMLHISPIPSALGDTLNNEVLSCAKLAIQVNFEG